MSRVVRVGSVETLKELRVSLCTFADMTSRVLDEADSEIQRTIGWLKRDQYTYWKAQIRQRAEKFSQAKLTLDRKQNIETSPIGGKYSFVDEKKALAAAQRQLQEARQKLEKVRHWTVHLEQEVFNYKGLVQGLANAANLEIPNARAQLDKMIDALESYAALAPPVDTSTTKQALHPGESAPVEQAPPVSGQTTPPPAAGENYEHLREKTSAPAGRNHKPPPAGPKDT